MGSGCWMPEHPGAVKGETRAGSSVCSVAAQQDLCVTLSSLCPLYGRYQSLNLTHVPEHSAPIYEFR